MKKIIILEGIATSGKTTLKEKLAGYFHERSLKTLVINEEQTLMPILENTKKEVSIELLNKVINEALASDSEVVIFDRLYFTHIFRTASTFEDFSVIENLLLEHQALIALLTIEKTSIEDRIFKAMGHRDEKWSAFVKKKGTDEEIVQYYMNQQDALAELTQKSKLPTIILDMTTNDYEGAVVEIIKKINMG